MPLIILEIVPTNNIYAYHFYIDLVVETIRKEIRMGNTIILKDYALVNIFEEPINSSSNTQAAAKILSENK